MPTLFGKRYSRKEILRRVGDISQLGGIRLVELLDGNTRGVRAADFATATGLTFTVLLDRGMDIGPAAWRGRPLAWNSMTGPVHPAFFEPQGLGFLRSFHGGLLCTCGLTWCGPPCTDEGQELGLHGRASHIPARQVSVHSAWEGDEYLFSVEGTVREASVFGPNVSLTRTVSARLGDDSFRVRDVIRNEGFEPAPLMLLYHINAGFPVVSEHTELLSPTKSIEPVTDYAASIAERYNRFDPPTHGIEEACYRHKLASARDGTVIVALVNRKLDGGFGYYIRYNRRQLPHFTEWKMMGEGMYVVGTEPCTMPLASRAELRERGELEFLEPDEERTIELEIGVVTGPRRVKEIEAFCRKHTASRKRRR